MDLLINHYILDWKINDKCIKIDTIDNLCKGKNISLFHIDVEGMEYKCLLGSVETIQNVEYIMIELNSISDRNKEVDFLTKNNFIDINDTNIQKENGNHLFKKNIDFNKLILSCANLRLLLHIKVLCLI